MFSCNFGRCLTDHAGRGHNLATHQAVVQRRSRCAALCTGASGWPYMVIHPDRPVWIHRQTIIHGQAQEGRPERGQRSATPSASLAAATPAASTEAGVNNDPPQQAPDSARTIAYAAAPGIIRTEVKDEAPSTQDAVMADPAADPAAGAAAGAAAAGPAPGQAT